MDPLFFICLAFTSVSTHGFALDVAPLHRQCDSDHQCDNGFFCYEESHFCTRCLECSSYKRKSSWRSCAKTPSDCGSCITGHEEEILHEGKTRDICVPSFPNNLSHTNVPEHSYPERILWAAAVTGLVLPIVYFVFSRKNRVRGYQIDRGTIHRDLCREEPPPYRSIELTTLSSNNSEEQLSEEDHVMCVGQQKDHLVQAVPFQKPAYLDEELLAFDNAQSDNRDEPEHLADEAPVATVGSVELHDENTMPSDWTPDENSNGQMLSFELALSSGCEPAAKRHKSSEAQPTEDGDPTSEEFNSHNNNLSINLFINNNVTIHKPY